MIKLKWHGEMPENLEEIEAKVKEDLVDIHDALEGDSGELIFHHVFLGKSHDDPLVFVWGEEGDNEYYHCEYDPHPKWKSFGETEESLDSDRDLN
jgi:hypothetical protein